MKKIQFYTRVRVKSTNALKQVSGTFAQLQDFKAQNFGVYEADNHFIVVELTSGIGLSKERSKIAAELAANSVLKALMTNYKNFDEMIKTEMRKKRLPLLPKSKYLWIG